ncbi:Alpha/beta hydrolase family domain-containing protein [Trichoderma austrokoningii]
MQNLPTLVFVPGAWHGPSCYDLIIKLLQEKHGLKCSAITLPTTNGDPDKTFKDDLDAARKAVSDETSNGRDVVVIAHSYGGLVGNSVIKGFARKKAGNQRADASKTPAAGHVIGLILIASGYTFTGLTFMDPFLGHPPPTWRKNNGMAEIVVSPRQFFYHDLPADEAEYRVSLLRPQSLRALYEGGEYSYSGWLDVPSFYLGTIEDQGLPVVVQRMNVGMARAMGASVEHRELQTSHSPFFSQPEATVNAIVEAVEAFTGKRVGSAAIKRGQDKRVKLADPGLLQPLTWFKFGLPLVLGHIIGKCVLIFQWGRRLWKHR